MTKKYFSLCFLGGQTETKLYIQTDRCAEINGMCVPTQTSVNVFFWTPNYLALLSNKASNASKL